MGTTHRHQISCPAPHPIVDADGFCKFLTEYSYGRKGVIYHPTLAFILANTFAHLLVARQQADKITVYQADRLSQGLTASDSGNYFILDEKQPLTNNTIREQVSAGSELHVYDPLCQVITSSLTFAAGQLHASIRPKGQQDQTLVVWNLSTQWDEGWRTTFRRLPPQITQTTDAAWMMRFLYHGEARVLGGQTIKAGTVLAGDYANMSENILSVADPTLYLEVLAFRQIKACNQG